MVLIAAAICTKGGKALLSRQFVEMTKSRIEGLLAAFPKLMSTGKAAQQQHTFVETEAVRYVYQPLEKLYVLLITTRASNILEDLETLRLFARVVPEYCRSMEEAEILDNAFSLLFAFDEIVALGYRENVNLAQIRTFVEMDSHEEKVYQAVRQTQEREAKIKMREKAKELQRQRVEASKRGFKSPGMNSGGFGPGSGFVPSPIVGDSASSGPNETPKPSYTPSVSKPSGPSKALKLGGKSKDADSFVDQLKSEGEHVSATTTTKSALASVSKGTAPNIPTQSVQLRIEEKLQLTAGRDGGLQNMEIHGIITLCITEEAFGRIRLHLENKDKRGIQLQTHPNVDKDLFKAKAQIALKTPAKPFPLNADVGVLKWRFQTQDENLIPLTINCWPSENGKGGCDVNIEYDLQDEALELQDVVIAIPIAVGAGSPMVSEYEGEYQYEPRKNVLLWRLPLVDASNKNGSLEFTCNGLPNDFFPINVSFTSSKSYADLKVVDVLTVDEGTPVKYSIDTVFFPEKYEIL